LDAKIAPQGVTIARDFTLIAFHEPALGGKFRRTSYWWSAALVSASFTDPAGA